LPNDASRIWIGHLFRVDGRILALFRGRVLQAETGSAGIPEVAAVEVTLSSVVLERWEIRRVYVTLWIALGDAIVGVSMRDGNGHRTRIRSASEHAENGNPIAISSGGIVAVTASQITVH